MTLWLVFVNPVTFCFLVFCKKLAVQKVHNNKHLDAATIIVARMHYFKMAVSHEGKLLGTRLILKRYELIFLKRSPVLKKLIFKPGARPLAARAWSLEIVLVRLSVCVCVCMYVCVCVSAPEAINNQWHDMV